MASNSEPQPPSLREIGEKLQSASSTPKESLLKLLKQAASQLLDIQQSATVDTKTNLVPCTKALALPAIFKHRDKDVRLLAASCLTDVLRIFAPEPPYSDDQLKEIFQLFVAIFDGLKDVSSPSFPRRVNILDGLAKVKSCIVMLDLDCDDLIGEMFQTFFNTTSDEHPKNLKLAMRDVMCTIIDESETLPQPLLSILLENLLSRRKETTRAAKTPAHELAAATIQRSADSLKEPVQRLLLSNRLVGRADDSAGALGNDYHNLIYELFSCAPQVLLTVLPHLQEELAVDQVDIRLKAVELLGRLFSLPGQRVAENYRQLFSEFLKRFQDKAPEVRIAMVAWAKACLLASPTGPETVELISSLNKRLLDYDEKVRLKAVVTVCDLAVEKPKLVSVETLKSVADRLRDKKVQVRKGTLPELLKVLRNFCERSLKGKSVSEEEYEWIPSRVMKCGYDKECKEFRPPALDLVLEDELFSPKLSIEDRARHWVSFFSVFDKNDKKMLMLILSHRQRLQQEFSSYLKLRQQLKGSEEPELRQKLQATLEKMAISFVDPSKAEELFQRLHQLKDNHIFKAFASLLDPNTTLTESRVVKDELLKRIPDKQIPAEFVKSLATRISFTLFGKEHVGAVLAHLKAKLNSKLVKPGMELLAEFAGHFPALLEDSRDDLLALLREEDEQIKEGAAHILSKCGNLILSNAVETLSPVEASMLTMCLEGTRKQAKHAVATLASLPTAVTSLTALYQRLAKSLTPEAGEGLLPVLQSLGCIAQIKVFIFEAQEDHIVRYIVRDILRRPSALTNRNGWANPSVECKLKVYGLKLLTKSFLPDVPTREPRSKLKGLLNVLFKLLPLGEITDDIVSSDIDKAHIRLAAAKAVLRLARRWDYYIPPYIYLATLQTAQDPIFSVRKEFVGKVAKFIRDRSLPHRYACTYPLGSVDVEKENINEAKKYLMEFVEQVRREVRARQNIAGATSEGSTLTTQPEYVLTYLIWVLAHHPDFPTKEEAEMDSRSYFEPFEKQLYCFLRAVLHQDGGDVRPDLSKREDVDNFPAVLAILRSLKEAVDAVDEEMTENLYILCDMGILIATNEGLKKPHATNFPGEIQLPTAFFKPPPTVDGPVLMSTKADFSHLPSYLKESEGKAKPRQASGKAKKVKREEEDSEGEEEPVSKKARRKGGAEIVTPPLPSPASASDKDTRDESMDAMEEDTKDYGEELLDRKIKVWWPLDKKFYPGTICGYSAKTGKHKVEYEDGEKEHLRLDKERWEFADAAKGKGTPRGRKGRGSAIDKALAEEDRVAGGQTPPPRADKVNDGSMGAVPEQVKRSMRAGDPVAEPRLNAYRGEQNGEGLPASKSGDEDRPEEGETAAVDKSDTTPEEMEVTGDASKEIQSMEELGAGKRGKRGRPRQAGGEEGRVDSTPKMSDEAATDTAELRSNSDRNQEAFNASDIAPASEAANQGTALQSPVLQQSNTPGIVEKESGKGEMGAIGGDHPDRATSEADKGGDEMGLGGSRSGVVESKGKGPAGADAVASPIDVEDEPKDTIRSRRRRFKR